MKIYIMITGAIFGLITLAHIWRMVEEGSRLVKEPWYAVLTLIAATLCLWAARLLWTTRGASGGNP
ncbi:MAG: hypothetical protein ABI822_06050 [Bryobacteraceae bacterium]